MSGPTQPWDQSGDPRESTVDLPRLDLSELANYFRGTDPGGGAQPGEPGFASAGSRDHGSREPAMPQPAGLLEPLPRPDSGGFSRPSRRPAGFMDPYAEPVPRSESAPRRGARPAEPAPPPSLAPRGSATAPPSAASRPDELRTNGDRLPRRMPSADANAGRRPGPVPNPNTAADRLPRPFHDDADASRRSRPLPSPDANRRSGPVPYADGEADAARLLGQVRFASATSPGHASVADFAVGPVDASIALNRTPVSEAPRGAPVGPAQFGPTVADASPATGRAEPASAISQDPIPSGAPAAAKPSPAPTAGAGLDDDLPLPVPAAADTGEPAASQTAAPRTADAVRAPEAATPAKQTPELPAADQTPLRLTADQAPEVGTVDRTKESATVDPGPGQVTADAMPGRVTADAMPGPVSSDRGAADAAPRDRSARPAQAGRPSAGSMADLRSRLARLPDGHPSSPYDDGGQARPLPTRLKQLELGLPAPGRELAGSSWPDIDTDHSGRDRTSARTLAAAIDDSSLDDSSLDDLADGPAAGTSDEPPAAPTRAEHHAAPAPNHADAADPPRSEWQDPYAGGSRPTGAGRPGELAPGPWQAGNATAPGPLDRRSAGRRDGHGNGTNGNANGYDPRTTSPAANRPESRRPDPPQQDARRQDAQQQDRARRDTVEHPRRPPGAAQPDSGLRPRPPDARRPEATDELRALVEHTLASCRAAEGRNVFGGYGSSGLTPLIRRMAAQLPFGALASGSEADSLKPPDRFAAKLARLMARNPGRPPEELAQSIGDAVRYAFAFETADYIEGTWLVHRRLKSHGFELEVRRNRWESPEHKGIFTMWRDPAHGLAFEVQFHTTASWAVLRQTHDIYVQITDPTTRPAERAQLRARQAAAAATAKAPPNWAEIADFRLEPK